MKPEAANSLIRLPEKVVWRNELSAVRSYCRAYVAQLQRLLGLSDYQIDVIVSYDPNGNQAALVAINDMYTQAVIKLNYANIDDIDWLHYCLCHEVCHCMQHEYETTINAAYKMVGEMGSDVLKHLYDKACEAATIRFAKYLVRAFEPVYDKIKEQGENNGY